MQKYEIIGLGEMIAGGISTIVGIYSSITSSNPNALWISGSMGVFADGFVRQADKYGGIERFFKYLKKDND